MTQPKTKLSKSAKATLKILEDSKLLKDSKAANESKIHHNYQSGSSLPKTNTANKMRSDKKRG